MAEQLISVSSSSSAEHPALSVYRVRSPLASGPALCDGESGPSRDGEGEEGGVITMADTMRACLEAGWSREEALEMALGLQPAHYRLGLLRGSGTQRYS